MSRKLWLEEGECCEGGGYKMGKHLCLQWSCTHPWKKKSLWSLESVFKGLVPWIWVWQPKAYACRPVSLVKPVHRMSSQTHSYLNYSSPDHTWYFGLNICCHISGTEGRCCSSNSECRTALIRHFQTCALAHLLLFKLWMIRVEDV